MRRQNFGCQRPQIVSLWCHEVKLAAIVIAIHRAEDATNGMSKSNCPVLGELTVISKALHFHSHQNALKIFSNLQRM